MIINEKENCMFKNKVQIATGIAILFHTIGFVGMFFNLLVGLDSRTEIEGIACCNQSIETTLSASILFYILPLHRYSSFLFPSRVAQDDGFNPLLLTTYAF